MFSQVEAAPLTGLLTYIYIDGVVQPRSKRSAMHVIAAASVLVAVEEVISYWFCSSCIEYIECSYERQNNKFTHPKLANFTN